MLEIDKYIENMKNKKDEFRNNFEYIKYVYIDLGRKFSFDPNYFFGNSKEKNKIYKKIKKDVKTLNNYFISEIIICKSLCYICEYIFNHLGFDTATLLDYNDGKHTYNSILIDGSMYFFDLQSDLVYIKANFRTRYFLYNNNITFNAVDDNNIDSNIGYSKIEDLIEDLKFKISYDSSLNDIIYTLIDEIYIRLKISEYIERNKLFIKIATDIFHTTRYKNKFKFCHCINAKTGEYINLLSISYLSSLSIIFYYDNEKYKYIKISNIDLLSLLNNDLKIKSGGIFIGSKILTKDNITSFF